MVSFLHFCFLVFLPFGKWKNFQIPNGLIKNVERGALTVLGSSLVLRCKHFLELTFLIPKDKECQDLYETLTRCSRPGILCFLFKILDSGY